MKTKNTYIVLIDTYIVDLDVYTSTKEINITLAKSVDIDELESLLVVDLVNKIVTEKDNIFTDGKSDDDSELLRASLTNRFADPINCTVDIFTVPDFIEYMEYTDMHSEPAYILTLNTH